jgi:hypothetical protein
MEVRTGRFVLLGLWVAPVLVVATALVLALICTLAW